MIGRISLALANYLASQRGEGPDEREVYYYGFQIMIGSAVKLAVVSVVSLALGAFVPTMVAMGTAAAFRSITGGSHCTTYNRCLIAGAAAFISLGWLARSLSAPGCLPYLIPLAALSGFFVTAVWAPVDHPNKPLAGKESRTRLKRYGMGFLCLWVAGAVALTGWGDSAAMLVGASSLGVLWQTLTLTPIGSRFIAALDHGLALVRLD